jgi:hypothetical protein
MNMVVEGDQFLLKYAQQEIIPVFNAVREIFPWAQAQVPTPQPLASTQVALFPGWSRTLWVKANSVEFFVEATGNTTTVPFTEGDPIDMIGAISTLVGHMKKDPAFRKPFFQLFTKPGYHNQGFLTPPDHTSFLRVPLDYIRQEGWLDGLWEISLYSLKDPLDHSQIKLSINDFLEEQLR